MICQNCQEPTGKAPQAKWCTDCKILQRRISSSKWNVNNPLSILESRKKYYYSHHTLERNKSSQWKKNNPKVNSLHSYSRKINVKQATPLWLNIQDLVEKYNLCPIGLTVDHIVPIKGKNVSGLHVPWNLQYLTSKENSRKGNRFES